MILSSFITARRERLCRSHELMGLWQQDDARASAIQPSGGVVGSSRSTILRKIRTILSAPVAEPELSSSDESDGSPSHPSTESVMTRSKGADDSCQTWNRAGKSQGK